MQLPTRAGLIWLGRARNVKADVALLFLVCLWQDVGQICSDLGLTFPMFYYRPRIKKLLKDISLLSILCILLALDFSLFLWIMNAYRECLLTYTPILSHVRSPCSVLLSIFYLFCAVLVAQRARKVSLYTRERVPYMCMATLAKRYENIPCTLNDKAQLL